MLRGLEGTAVMSHFNISRPLAAVLPLTATPRHDSTRARIPIQIRKVHLIILTHLDICQPRNYSPGSLMPPPLSLYTHRGS